MSLSTIGYDRTLIIHLSLIHHNNTQNEEVRPYVNSLYVSYFICIYRKRQEGVSLYSWYKKKLVDDIESKHLSIIEN